MTLNVSLKIIPGTETPLYVSLAKMIYRIIYSLVVEWYSKQKHGIMPRRCAIVGYNTEAGEGYSLHEFPFSDAQNCTKWTQAVQKK